MKVHFIKQFNWMQLSMSMIR